MCETDLTAGQICAVDRRVAHPAELTVPKEAVHRDRDADATSRVDDARRAETLLAVRQTVLDDPNRVTRG